MYSKQKQRQAEIAEQENRDRERTEHFFLQSSLLLRSCFCHLLVPVCRSVNHKNGNGGSQKFFSQLSTPSTHSWVLGKRRLFLRIWLPYTCNRRFSGKRRFSNTLSRVESFGNGDSLYLCGRAKTEVSKYDDVLPKFRARSLHIQLEDATNGRRSVLNTKKKYPLFSKNNTRLRVDGQIGFKTATCGRRFF